MTTVTECLTDTGPLYLVFTTCERSEDATFALWMSSPAAFLARTLVWRAGALVSERAREAAYGLSSPVLLASYDRESCSWRTLQLSLPGMEVSLLATLPRWGTLHRGALSQQPTPERPTFENDGGVSQWPTPKAHDDNRSPEAYREMLRKRNNGQVKISSLQVAIKDQMWPTPAQQEPGWKNLEIVDRDGNSPRHFNQRFYDKKTGRLVQKGLTQAVLMWPTPRANERQQRNSRDNYKALSLEVKLWPTPAATDDSPRTEGNGTIYVSQSGTVRRKNTNGTSSNLGLSASVQNWATPTVQDAANNGAQSQHKRNSLPLNAQTNGALNPAWVESLMGYPPGWTALDGGPAGPPD
jgi:hypothetical protein